MKKYTSPACEVVNIKKQDIVTDSLLNIETNVYLWYNGAGSGAARAAERGFYNWDAGY